MENLPKNEMGGMSGMIAPALGLLGGIEGLKEKAKQMVPFYDSAMIKVLKAKRLEYEDIIKEKELKNLGYMQGLSSKDSQGFMLIAFKMPKDPAIKKEFVILEMKTTRELLNSLLDSIKLE